MNNKVFKRLTYKAKKKVISIAGFLTISLPITVTFVALLSVTVFDTNFNFSRNTDNSATNMINDHGIHGDVNVNHNHFHSHFHHVPDPFLVTQRTGEWGNPHYIVHPSRYGSPRSFEVEVLAGQSTVVEVVGN